MIQDNLDSYIKSKQRQKIIGTILIVIGVLIFILFPFMAIRGSGFFENLDASPFFGVIAGIIFFAFGIALTSKSSKDLKDNVGATIAKEVLGSYFDDLVYDPQRGFDYRTIKSVDMGFPGFDDAESNDYISATYKGHKLEMCDLHLTDTRVVSNGKTSRTEHVTVFRGPYMKIGYDKSISHPVIINERAFLFNGDRIEMENEAFNKEYNVYCEDEHDAFYIITPHMMERIERVNGLADDKIFINFNNDGYLYIAIYNNHNSFEISMSDDSSLAIKESFKKELDYLLRVIDELIEGLN